ncbi:MAG: adenosylmethionine decarboxylase [Phycisphaerae bacterium]
MKIPPGGEHCILELSECPTAKLTDEDLVCRSVRDATEKCGATLLNMASHRFDPPGVSVVALLAESHISVHTWPEEGYVAVDVFTCGSNADPQVACEHIAEALEAEKWWIKPIARRPGGDPDLIFRTREPRTPDRQLE